MPIDFGVFVDFLNQIRAGFGEGGWIVAIGTLIYGFVQIYRRPLFQRIIVACSGFGPLGWMKYLVWDNLNAGGKALVVAVPAFVGTFLLTFATGTWMAALIAGFGAVVVAMGNRKLQKIIFAKKAGIPMDAASDMMAEDQRNTALKTEMPKISDR